MSSQTFAALGVPANLVKVLADRGITTPAAIGAALALLPAEAVKLLTRHQWRDGDVALLEAAAARLGLRLPEAPAGWPTGHTHKHG